ncbi:MAG: hypothetical protein ACN6NU_07705 [Acinetobacter sp.]
MIKYFNKFIIVFVLSFSNITCAENKILDCNFSNVNESLQCVLEENKKLLNKLDNLNNSKKSDYKDWKGKIRNTCESKIRYSMGEGAALAKEQCLRDEYILRIKDISKTYSKKNNLKKNDDGFLITSLPYNSDNHLKCILKSDKNSCRKINLINVSELSKVYNFLNSSFGSSVVLPESNNGLLIVISPFSEENGENFINLAIVNNLGVVKNITLNASNNIMINKNYEVIFYKGKNKSKIILK